MAKYLTIPVADGDSLANAKIHNSEALSGLTNGTSYQCFRLSEASTAFTPASAGTDWWTTGALVDIDYENDRAYVNGTAYVSVAAARTAGAIVVNGADVDTVPIAPGASYSMAFTGNVISASATQCAVGVDDGTAANWAFLGATNSRGPSAGSFVAGSTVINAYSSSLANGTAIRSVMRIKASGYFGQTNGAAFGSGGAMSGATIPAVTAFVVKNRSDGARPWAGTLRRVCLVNADLDDAAVAALLAG